MNVKLGKVARVDSSLILDLKNWNFNFSDELKKELGIAHAAVFLDKESQLLFTYVELKDYETYRKLEKQNKLSWWDDMTPIQDLDQYHNLLDYVWRKVFAFKDKVD